MYLNMYYFETYNNYT